MTKISNYLHPSFPTSAPTEVSKENRILTLPPEITERFVAKLDKQSSNNFAFAVSGIPIKNLKSKKIDNLKLMIFLINKRAIIPELFYEALCDLVKNNIENLKLVLEAYSKHPLKENKLILNINFIQLLNCATKEKDEKAIQKKVEEFNALLNSEKIKTLQSDHSSQRVLSKESIALIKIAFGNFKKIQKDLQKDILKLMINVVGHTEEKKSPPLNATFMQSIMHTLHENYRINFITKFIQTNPDLLEEYSSNLEALKELIDSLKLLPDNDLEQGFDYVMQYLALSMQRNPNKWISEYIKYEVPHYHHLECKISIFEMLMEKITEFPESKHGALFISLIPVLTRTLSVRERAFDEEFKANKARSLLEKIELSLLSKKALPIMPMPSNFSVKVLVDKSEVEEEFLGKTFYPSINAWDLKKLASYFLVFDDKVGSNQLLRILNFLTENMSRVNDKDIGNFLIIYLRLMPAVETSSAKDNYLKVLKDNFHRISDDHITAVLVQLAKSIKYLKTEDDLWGSFLNLTDHLVGHTEEKISPPLNATPMQSIINSLDKKYRISFITEFIKTEPDLLEEYSSNLGALKELIDSLKFLPDNDLEWGFDYVMQYLVLSMGQNSNKWISEYIKYEGKSYPAVCKIAILRTLMEKITEFPESKHGALFISLIPVLTRTLSAREGAFNEEFKANEARSLLEKIEFSLLSKKALPIMPMPSNFSVKVLVDKSEVEEEFLGKTFYPLINAWDLKELASYFLGFDDKVGSNQLLRILNFLTENMSRVNDKDIGDFLKNYLRLMPALEAELTLEADSAKDTFFKVLEDNFPRISDDHIAEVLRQFAISIGKLETETMQQASVDLFKEKIPKNLNSPIVTVLAQFANSIKKLKTQAMRQASLDLLSEKMRDISAGYAEETMQISNTQDNLVRILEEFINYRLDFKDKKYDTSIIDFLEKTIAHIKSKDSAKNKPLSAWETLSEISKKTKELSEELRNPLIKLIQIYVKNPKNNFQGNKYYSICEKNADLSLIKKFSNLLKK